MRNNKVLSSGEFIQLWDACFDGNDTYTMPFGYSRFDENALADVVFAQKYYAHIGDTDKKFSSLKNIDLSAIKRFVFRDGFEPWGTTVRAMAAMSSIEELYFYGEILRCDTDDLRFLGNLKSMYVSEKTMNLLSEEFGGIDKAKGHLRRWSRGLYNIIPFKHIWKVDKDGRAK